VCQRSVRPHRAATAGPVFTARQLAFAGRQLPLTDRFAWSMHRRDAQAAYRVNGYRESVACRTARCWRRIAQWSHLLRIRADRLDEP
jgi:hypothetical protein